jgi:hypothetical protein
MSTFKKEVGKVDLERVALMFQDSDLREVVKPEFVDAAAARGGALLNELKDPVRKILEPELIRSIEDPTDGSDHRGAVQDLKASKQPDGNEPH